MAFLFCSCAHSPHATFIIDENRYHRPSDEYQSGWDLEGAEKTAKIVFYLAYRAAMDDAMPAWNAGDEFEAPRLEALKKSGSGSTTP